MKIKESLGVWGKAWKHRARSSLSTQGDKVREMEGGKGTNVKSFRQKAQYVSYFTQIIKWWEFMVKKKIYMLHSADFWNNR